MSRTQSAAERTKRFGVDTLAPPPARRGSERRPGIGARSVGRTDAGSREAARFGVDVVMLSLSAAVCILIGAVDPVIGLSFTAVAIAAHVLSGSYRPTLS